MTIDDIMNEVELYFDYKKQITDLDKEIEKYYEQITELYTTISNLNAKKSKLEKMTKDELYGTSKQVTLICDTGPAVNTWVDDKDGRFEHIRKYLHNKKLKSIDDIYNQILKDCGIKPSDFTKYDIDIKKLYNAPYGEQLNIKDYLIKEDNINE